MKAITGKTKLLGVLGHPIGHTLSPAMHNAALEHLGLDYRYLAFDVHPSSLGDAVAAVRALGIAGLNVTIPHKKDVIPLLDEISPEAKLIGSVNTIKNEQGRLIGSSTDGEGFLQSLEAVGVDPRGKRAVVLGAGGSARAVAHALVANGAVVTLSNRTLDRAESLARRINEVTAPGSVSVAPLAHGGLKEVIGSADMLVNCTSVGMCPNVDSSPCLEDLLHSGLVVYDLIYNPLRTKLMSAAENVGAMTVSGLKMLVYQGAVSFRIWTGIDPPVDVMENAVLAGLTA